ncbi:hypothetical protein A5640_09595 [Mycobacterium asiaticum]|uniref:TIR domain-containing protein n=1 Tax=Mycobacterium asiaticum TaxID=1790 RepID=A0A1A3KQA2_MYCAS|nr:hypothetical protein A5640_09595 [Mycobacterium asiaticum]
MGGLLDLVEAVAAGDDAPQSLVPTNVPLPGLRGHLALIGPGAQDETYAGRLHSVNWSWLYQERGLGSVLERLRSRWTTAYDFVLVDSRTGITDIGGICTVQLPDVLVLMFTANRQSLDGAIDVAQRAVLARNHLPYDRANLMTLPIPSRFDAERQYERAVEWQSIFADNLAPLYDDWAVSGITPQQILERTTIPYSSYWSFGEELPILLEPKKNPSLISYHLETLAALVAHRLARSELLIESRDSFVDAAARTGLRGGRYSWDVFISHARETGPLAQQLAGLLSERSLRVWVDETSLRSGENWSTSITDALSRSQNLVVLIGTTLEAFQEREVSAFLRQRIDEQSARKVFPVLTQDTKSAVPPLLADTQYLSVHDQPLPAIASTIAQALPEQGLTG